MIQCSDVGADGNTGSRGQPSIPQPSFWVLVLVNLVTQLIYKLNVVLEKTALYSIPSNVSLTAIVPWKYTIAGEKLSVLHILCFVL